MTAIPMHRPFPIHLVPEPRGDIAALAVELGGLGHPVTVLARRDSPHRPDRVELAPGVVVEHLDAGPGDEDARLPAFAAHLARRWAADPPAVVHARSWASGRAAVRAAAGRIPVVLTFRAPGAGEGHAVGDEAELARRVDHVVAGCSDEADELAALGLEPDRVTVVPSGVDPALFRPVGPRLRVPHEPGRDRPSRYRLVVVVGRLEARRGVDDVVRALARVPETELVVAGGPTDPRGLADDPEARRLRAVAEREGVADRVTLLGAVPPSLVPALLRTADVVVSAPWYEPFGIVAVEAMACGKPVVGTAVGGQLDTVHPERTGMLVEPHDPAGIAEAVGRLLSNPSLRHRMGEEAVAVVRERYTWEQVARSTLEVYERLVRTGSWWAVPV